MRAPEPAASATPQGVTLIADPDAFIRASFRRLLEPAGFRIMEATDGRDALVKALVHSPRLIIAEARLPIMDGFALCEIVRRDRATCHVPILFVTSDAGPAIADRASTVGVDAVLPKPPNLDSLLAEARRLIRGRHDPALSTFGSSLRLSSLTRKMNGRADAREPGRPRMTGSRAHARFSTTAPPASPPDLHCPSCGSALEYRYSYMGGVSSRHPEQWDYFVCGGTCGVYEYRHRTRRLRRVDPVTAHAADISLLTGQ